MLSKESKLVGLTSSVLFLLALKYVIDHGAEALPYPLLQLILHALLPVAGGLIALSFGSLLGSFADVEDSPISHLLRRASDDLERNFFVGFLITAYLSFVRPPLAANILFLPYVEWVAVALAVGEMYFMTKFSAKELYVSSGDAGWKRHIQEARRVAGPDLIRVTSVIEQFIENGVKEPLLIYLTVHLQRLAKTEEEILKILSPLIDYQEKARGRRGHLLAFPWTKRRLAVVNKKAREDLLNTLLERIERLRTE